MNTLETTSLAADLVKRGTILNESVLTDVNIVALENDSFNIEFEEDGQLVDEDCYYLEGNEIYHCSSPIGGYLVGTLGEDNADDVANCLIRLGKEVKLFMSKRK